MSTQSPAGREPPPAARLPLWSRVLVVVAHPDDESFGLGAVIDGFARAGAEVDVLCLTMGEASTLGATADLAAVRADELRRAANALGARSALLRAHPDGALGAVDPALLDDDVAEVARRTGPDGLLLMDPSGISGHPDHQAATAAGVRTGRLLDLPVLGWTLDDQVAAQLRAETGVPFVGHPAEQVDLRIEVNRIRQREAVAAHASQAVPGSVLWRRLDLQGDHEMLRWLV